MEASPAAEARRTKAAEQREDRLVMYKTKLVQFLGRSTPIILQNDNGPCPLLAICNVLLLRNAISLNPDVPEVSQDQLLAMVADRLLESNSDVKSKDNGYMNNQQQNISDAIDLLPRLATGIDVNVHFRKSDDFEFTRECAIFDLLDIGLYHGWIVDPQDKDTAKALGSKSYNTLVGELVALETQNSEARIIPPEEDTVDFAAATAAALGIPSPCLSRGLSFDDPLPIVLAEKVGRKGDLEEEAELMKVLTLSRCKVSAETAPTERSLSHEITCSIPSSDHEEEAGLENPGIVKESESLVGEMNNNSDAIPFSELLSSPDGNISEGYTSKIKSCGVILENESDSLNCGITKHSHPSESRESEHVQVCTRSDDYLLSSPQHKPDSVVANGPNILVADGSEENSPEQCSSETKALAESIFGQPIYQNNGDSVVSIDCIAKIDIGFSTRRDLGGAHQSTCSNVDGGEPIYEGEECILDPVHSPYENQEPVYEGEVLLAEQVDKMEANASVHSDRDASGKKDGGLMTISSGDGQLIQTFLKNNASQLTIYGLFRLQEGLNERELCVFFRNNHFSTLFKFKEELYLLVTDQGYLNQPDLVWEKLNEVNGDTVFMTGNFTEFRMENQSDSWSQQNAMTDTADFLAMMEGSEGSNLSSDLQLAIALQEQEFDQQPVCPESQTSQRPPVSRPRLVTGPQVPPRPAPSPKAESKSKENKCVVM